MFRSTLRRALSSSTTVSCLQSFRLQQCSVSALLSNGMLCRSIRGVRCPNAAAILPFQSPFAVATRSGSSVTRAASWRAAPRTKASWRQARKAQTQHPATSNIIKSNSKSASKAGPMRRNPSRATARKPALRRPRPHSRKLSPYQRQTEKYNKRVVAIARLWKEQRKGVQKKKKFLASRLV
ncbi:hypothetical protein ABB37_04056 [Leptomonas pyrrhocoris]|uniref:Uncharacterized protein n=1 Tax=Leptomonas pyrrhocoris TaxID=157538 RepID=A0A0M9G475_LEPPY|nr:hypothetical protein ABB37_04056 [Leptomonas pyrrhocoris]KPA81776.1 hypothetical protein ABB37_04056 [Leptomonas pyrrhocoris]|eukprot:XP_015660215.1 hypothetical protein ABB37_04056 [Leptomonas pyrrhocoris]